MADECAYVSEKEQMSICLRYVSKEAVVNEDFLCFVEMSKCDAESIANDILRTLRKHNLDIAYLRGQGYDGANVMSRNTSGVKTRIQELQPRAFYHHCRAHVLNLVLSSTCKAVPVIRNLFDSVNEITWFLGASPKRKSTVEQYLLEDDTADNVSGQNENEGLSAKLVVEATTKKSLPKLCQTRWYARLDTLSTLIAKYKTVSNALQHILDESSSSDARIKAGSFIRRVRASEFIMSLIIAQHILSFTMPLSQALQKVNCDIFKAHVDAQHCKSVIQSQRSEDIFQTLYDRASSLAECVDVRIEKPRVTGRMAHRAAAGEINESARAYYGINMYYPFVDHCVAQLEERFPVNMPSLLLASKLVPKLISTATNVELGMLFDCYNPDSPSPDTFYNEIQKWKVFCSEKDEGSISESLILADPDFYPNVHEILHIHLTMPVGAVPCERSLSAMRRLKDWSRSTMTEDRFNGIETMYVHRDIDVDRNRVLDRFDATGHRRIGKLQF